MTTVVDGYLSFCNDVTATYFFPRETSIEKSSEHVTTTRSVYEV